MEKRPKRKIDLREIWLIVRRRKHVIIWPFLVILAGAIAMGLTSEPTYECSTTILIEEKSKLSGPLAKIVSQVNTKMRMGLFRRKLLSHDNMVHLIEKLDLKNNVDLRKEAEHIKKKYPNLTLDEIMEMSLVESLRKKIDVEAKDNVLEISVEGRDPDKIYMLVKILSELFMEDALKDEQEDTHQLIEFSMSQLEIYKNRLAESERKLHKFQQENTERQLNNPSAKIMENWQQYNSMLASTEIELDQMRELLSYLDSKIKDSGNGISFSNNSQIQKLDRELSGMAYRLHKLMKQFSPLHPQIIKLNDEIAFKRREIREQIERIARANTSIKDNTLLDYITRREIILKDIDFLNQKKKDLSELITGYKTNVSRAPLDEAILEKLTREVELNRDMYNKLLLQSQGSEIAEALQMQSASSKFRITEPANKPFEPKSTKKRIIFLGFIFGLLVSVGLVSLLEKMDHSFKNAKEIEDALGVIVLGTVPKINFLAHNSSAIGKKRVAMVAVPAVILVALVLFYAFKLFPF